MSALGDKDVGGLDVAVDDALRMGGVEAVGDFDGEGEQSFVFERASGDEVLEGDAVEVLHGDEGLVAMPADFVDGADVGVIEGGGGAGLAAEALEGLRVAREIVGKKLEGNETAEFGVFSFVDNTHASTAEFFDDAVVRDSLADQSRRVPHGGSILLSWGRAVNEEVGTQTASI